MRVGAGGGDPGVRFDRVDPGGDVFDGGVTFELMLFQRFEAFAAE